MLRSTRFVVLLGVAVQLVAFLRTAIIAATLGASPDVDAYNLGLIAPGFISTVIGSWLQISFIGRYASLVATRQDNLAAAYRSRMLILVAAVAVLFSTLCYFAPGPIMQAFLPASQTAMITASTDALKLSGLTLIPIIVGDFIGLVLNSHGRFFAAALAPLVNAIVSVAGLRLLPSLDLTVLVWTLLAGSLAQLLVIIAALIETRLTFTLETRVAAVDVRTTLALALPLLPAMMLGNSATALIQFRAAQVGEGAVAIYGYASRLHGALAQVLVIGLSTVLLPHFAALWSRGEKSQITLLFRRLARATALIAACATLSIWLMGESATKVLFQRGAFAAQNTEQVARLWFILSLALFPFAFGTFIAKFCQALREVGTVLASAVILFATTWIVTWLGASAGNLDIVAGATTASFIATCCFWLFWLDKRVESRPILTDIGQACLRAGLILTPAALAERWTALYAVGLPDLANLLVRGLSFVAVAACILIVTQSHRWFFLSQPGERKARQGWIPIFARGKQDTLANRAGSNNKQKSDDTSS
jgi:putative peptidoglycan lipid II flippase